MTDGDAKNNNALDGLHHSDETSNQLDPSSPYDRTRCVHCSPKEAAAPLHVCSSNVHLFLQTTSGGSGRYGIVNKTNKQHLQEMAGDGGSCDIDASAMARTRRKGRESSN